MRALYFIPFAYLAGVHGFALFAPYAAVVVTILALVRRYQSA